MGGGSAPVSVRDFCLREWPRLVGAVGLYTGDVDLAEECAQEALTRACRDWRRVSEMEAPGAWVHRVAINVANSHFRRWQARRRAESRLSSGAEHSYRDPEAADAMAVREAIAALPPTRRMAVVLRFYLGYSTADAAELMGVTESTVRSLIHRALKTLRASLSTDVALEELDG